MLHINYFHRLQGYFNLPVTIIIFNDFPALSQNIIIAITDNNNQ